MNSTWYLTSSPLLDEIEGAIEQILKVGADLAQRALDVGAPGRLAGERQQVSGDIERVDGVLGDESDRAVDIAWYPEQREPTDDIGRPSVGGVRAAG